MTIDPTQAGDPNAFNLAHSDLKAALDGGRAYDLRRIRREATRCLWDSSNTTPELLAEAVGPGLYARPGEDAVAVLDQEGNELGEIPHYRLAAPDWGYVVRRLTEMASTESDAGHVATLQSAVETIEERPWDVVDDPSTDVVLIPLAPPAAMLLARSFVVPGWPEDDDH